MWYAIFSRRATTKRLHLTWVIYKGGRSFGTSPVTRLSGDEMFRLGKMNSADVPIQLTISLKRFELPTKTKENKRDDERKKQNLLFQKTKALFSS